MYVSIEGIALKHSSDLKQPFSLLESGNMPRNEVFQCFSF